MYIPTKRLQISVRPHDITRRNVCAIMFVPYYETVILAKAKPYAIINIVPYHETTFLTSAEDGLNYQFVNPGATSDRET